MVILDIIFSTLGGLALFLFGLQILSGGFKKITGQKLQRILEKLTSNPWKGVAFGASITAIIQSSSITMVTLIGLVNAGLLNLKQAIGVMLGAEIGTTVTAQIVAFKIGAYYLPVIAVGFGFYFFARSQRLKHIGQIVLGFGILFLGMYLMKNGVKPLRDNEAFINLLKSFGQNPLGGVVAGAIFTGIIQSSSASIGVVIALASENLIGLPSAIALMLGANIGTCVTGLIASVKASIPARRTSIAQLITNILGVSILLVFIRPFTLLIMQTSANLPRQIANAHSVFNIAVTLMMMPLIGFLVWLTTKIVPGKMPTIDRNAQFLDPRILNSPSLALAQAKKETVRMAKIAKEMLIESFKALKNSSNDFILSVREKEEATDELCEALNKYLEKVSEKEISHQEGELLAILTHAVTDIERIGDHANNLAEIAQDKKKRRLNFSKQAQQDLELMAQKVSEALSMAIEALEENKKSAAKIALKIEKEVNFLDDRLQREHMARLEQGNCRPESGPLYLNIVSNLERISDHAENIAGSVIMGF